MKYSINRILFVIGFCLMLTACRGAAERQLIAAAEDYNRSCPIRMSDIIRIDSLHYDRAGHDMAFCCTVTGLSHGVMADDAALLTVMDYCEKESKTQLEQLKSNDYGRETIMLLKRAGATLSFAYALDDGTPLTRNTFTKTDM